MKDNKKIIISFIYKFLERLIVKGIGLLISIILARLLLPKQFGAIAILLVFIDIGQTFVQGGLNSALVQSKETTLDDYSTVFFISLFTAIITIIILWIFAPVIDIYYEKIGLVLPLRVFSLSLIFSALNSIQVAKLQREMKFKQIMICSTLASIISGIIGIFAAFMEKNIWSLIIYFFSNTVITCFVMMFVSKWKPKLVFSVSRAKTLFSYGWKMLVSSILCSLYNNIRSLIIGKLFSQEDLAYYNRGQQISDTVGNTLDITIQSVMFPVLSEVQDSDERTLGLLKKTISFGSFIIMPAMLGLAATSESLVSILLTDKWLPSVFYIEMICIGNMTIPLVSSNLVAIKSMGKSDLYMKLEVIRRIAMLVVLSVSAIFFDSAKAIAIGYFISAWLDFVIVATTMNYELQYGVIEQFRTFYKSFFAAIIMCIVIKEIAYLKLCSLVILLLQIICGIVLYSFMSIVLKNENIYILKNILSRMLKTSK